MVDRDLIISKADSAKKHIDRAIQKAAVGVEEFLEDSDRQDIVLFNIQMAVQDCLDIAAHIISEEGFGVPGSNNEMFYMLEEKGFIDAQLTEKMIKAVGFRNIIVHEYGKLDIKQVYEVSQKDIKDLVDYIKAIFKIIGIA